MARLRNPRRHQLHPFKSGNQVSILASNGVHSVKNSRRRTISGYLFGNRLAKTAPAFPRKAWEDALTVAKIKDFRFHDLRHTAASYLAMSGATLSEIAAFLGHRTLAMVARYSHLTEQHSAKVSGRMAQRFLG